MINSVYDMELILTSAKKIKEEFSTKEEFVECCRRIYSLDKDEETLESLNEIFDMMDAAKTLNSARKVLIEELYS